MFKVHKTDKHIVLSNGKTPVAKFDHRDPKGRFAAVTAINAIAQNPSPDISVSTHDGKVLSGAAIDADNNVVGCGADGEAFNLDALFGFDGENAEQDGDDNFDRDFNPDEAEAIDEDELEDA